MGVRRFLALADVVCIGGTMCVLFLSVLGHDVGHPPCSEGDLELVRRALAADASPGRLAPICDLLVGSGRGDLDIGPGTADRWAAEIDAATAVFWSGALGRVELAAFAGGMRAVAEAVSSASATTVVGGEQAVHALRTYGLGDRVNHLSPGGDASLGLLEGLEPPGLQALRGIPITAR